MAMHAMCRTLAREAPMGWVYSISTMAVYPRRMSQAQSFAQICPVMRSTSMVAEAIASGGYSQRG